jgi:hypothetical protein
MSSIVFAISIAALCQNRQKERRCLITIVRKLTSIVQDIIIKKETLVCLRGVLE